MAQYNSLKQAIQDVIRTNGNNEITGALLQQSLLAMINSLGVGYQFMGVATPESNPGTPDQQVLYVASIPGTYTNFGGLVVNEGELAFLYYDTTWHKGAVNTSKADNTVIHLSQWRSSPGAYLNVGEYGYDSTNDTIVYKTAYGNKVLQMDDNALYIYERLIYAHSEGRLMLRIDPPHLSKRIVGTSNTAGNEPCDFVQGHTYVIFNRGSSGGVNFFTRATPSGTNIDSLTISSGKYKTFIASADAKYLRHGAAVTYEVLDLSAVDGRVWSLEKSVEGLPEKVDDLKAQMESVLTGTSVEGGSEFAYTFRVGHRYRITNTGTHLANFSTRLTKSGATVETIGAIWRGGDSLIFTPTVEAYYLRIGQATTFRVEDLVLVVPTVEALNSETLAEPMVHFDIPHTLRDVSDDLEGINVYARDSIDCITLMDQIYAQLDSLVSAHPGLITREDIAETLELDYPAYASLGGSASEDYAATPTYKTYLYTIKSAVNAVNGASTDMTKRRLLLMAGTHGDERASIVNAYLFAKWLLESDDINAFKFRAAFDVYLLPCLNGYGIYHSQRPNADGIDLNRNYPYHHWAQSGIGTDNWTGPRAGSTFEVQLVMALTDSIKPDIAVDHHNYAVLERQFYTDGWGVDIAKIAHQSLVDCSYTFIKELPAYFGSAYKMFMASGDLPGSLPPDLGFAARYWYENEINVPLTIEISRCINYLSGNYAGEAQDNYGDDTFAVGDYTLRVQLMRFGEYALRKVKHYTY